MRKRILVCAICALLLAGASLAGMQGKAVDARRTAPVVQTYPEPAAGGIDRSGYLERQGALQSWLVSEIAANALAAPLTVQVGARDLARVERADAADPGKSVVGLVKPLEHRVDFADAAEIAIDRSGVPYAGGSLRATADGGYVWSVAVGSTGAHGLRVHLRDLRIPAGADLFLYSLEGQAFGPYRGDDVWTNTVFASTAVLQLHVYGPVEPVELSRIGLTIAEIGHVGPKFLPGVSIGAPVSALPAGDDGAYDVAQSAAEPGDAALAFCNYNDTCIENTSCGGGPSWSAKGAAEDATALMLWISGAFINTCTGGLVADTDGGSQIPYVLTANHCVNKQKDAKNIEFYFQYSVGCGSGCPSQWQGGGVQVSPTGSDLLSSSSNGDYTLLEMRGNPPGGSAFMGWTTAPVANADGTDLFRISHPSTAPQSYSVHSVDTSAFTCQGVPRGPWIYSRDTYGATEGGSSGSPVYNGAGQIVGQLTGACGTNTGDVCDAGSNATLDGAFAGYYANIASYLDPSPCVPSSEVCDNGGDDDCDGDADCDDSDCSGDPSCSTGGCTLGQPGDACTSDGDCCSNKCKGPPSGPTCR